MAPAGGLLVEVGGVIVEVDNFSGTFRFGPDVFPQVLTALGNQGADVSSVRRWPLTTTEYTATAIKVGDPSRWVRLTFGLHDGDALPTTTHLAVEPQDELAGTYGLVNWKSGLLSGYFWVCRRARRMPPPPISISELAGALSSDDMEGVVRAAEVVAARLLGVEAPPPSAEWRVTVSPAVPQPV